jgi:hypothetical protein
MQQFENVCGEGQLLFCLRRTMRRRKTMRRKRRRRKMKMTKKMKGKREVGWEGWTGMESDSYPPQV